MDNKEITQSSSDDEDKPIKSDSKDYISKYFNSVFTKKFIELTNNPDAFLSDTDSLLGGTITSLEALDLTMKRFQDDANRTSKPDIKKQVSEITEPIKEELQVVREQIQNTTNALGSMKGFIDENKEALTTLISVNGKMGGLEGQMDSLVGRVSELEADKKEKNQNKLNVFLIITTIISICIALASCAFGAVALYYR